jgi:hypothetical protein
MGGGRTVLATHVRDRIGHVDNALLEFVGAPNSDIGCRSLNRPWRPSAH